MNEAQLVEVEPEDVAQLVAILEWHQVKTPQIVARVTELPTAHRKLMCHCDALILAGAVEVARCLPTSVAVDEALGRLRSAYIDRLYSPPWAGKEPYIP